MSDEWKDDHIEGVLIWLRKVHARDPLDGVEWKIAGIAIEAIEKQMVEIEELKEKVRELALDKLALLDRELI